MEFDAHRPEWDMDMAEQESRKTPERRGGHGFFLIIVCLLLLGTGAGLFWKDLRRDVRHGICRCEGGRMLELPADPDEIKMSETAEGIAALAQVHPEIRQYMMLVPSSGFIQKRFLPEDLKIRDQAADLQRIRGGMPADLTWIDLTETFTSHEGEKLYYATDPHLTGWGSRYAARAVLRSMDAEIPEGRDNCYLLSDSFVGTLSQEDTPMHRFLERKPERIEIYIPENEVPYYRVDAKSGRWSGSLYVAEAAQGSDPLKVFFGGERPLTEIYTAAVNGETLLVAGDGTADTIVPLFVSSFEKIIFVHPAGCASSMEKLIEKYEPTGILYLYGANNFMKDRALLHCLGR